MRVNYGDFTFGVHLDISDKRVLRRGGSGGGSRYDIPPELYAKCEKIFKRFKRIMWAQMRANRTSARVNYTFSSTGKVLRYNKYNNFINSLRWQIKFVGKTGIRLEIYTSEMAPKNIAMYIEGIDSSINKTKTIRIGPNKRIPIFSREEGKVVWFSSGKSGKLITMRNKPINQKAGFLAALAAEGRVYRIR
jgi:hypothetical protein